MSLVGVVIDLVRSSWLRAGGAPRPPKLAGDRPIEEKDWWYGWRGIDAHVFWERILDIEDAGRHGGPDDIAAAAHRHGLPGIIGYARLKNTFVRRYGKNPAFVQAMNDVRARRRAQQGAAARAERPG